MTLETYTPSEETFPAGTESFFLSGWADGIDGDIAVAFTTDASGGNAVISYLTPRFGPWVVALDSLVAGDYEVEITQNNQEPWAVSFTIAAVALEEAGGLILWPNEDNIQVPRKNFIAWGKSPRLLDQHSLVFDDPTTIPGLGGALLRERIGHSFVVQYVDINENANDGTLTVTNISAAPPAPGTTDVRDVDF